ncbi:MAG: hypothetical protein QXP43_05175 [Nitrososphaerota archaeon]
MSSKDTLKVTLRHEGVEFSVEGDVTSVIRAVHEFVEKVVPAYSLARALSVDVSVPEFLESVKEHVVFDESIGFAFRPTAHGLPAPDQVLLYLALRRVEHLLGRRQSSSTNLRELSEGLGLKRGTLTGALSELRKSGFVRRLERGDYEVTPMGMRYLVERFSPRQQAG